MLNKLILLSVAGAAGTMLRFLSCSLVGRLAGSPNPFGTLAVNIAGCFAAGAAWAFFEGRGGAHEHARLAVLTGFMGAFTTFSAFMLDNADLVKASRLAAAAGNIAAQNVLCFAAVFAGAAVTRTAFHLSPR